MKDFRGKKVDNLGGISAEIVVIKNQENDRKTADTIGLLLNENNLQIELSNKQAIGMAISLLDAVFSEKYNLENELSPYGDVAQCLPIFVGKEKDLLGYLLALNDEDFHTVPTEYGEIEYTATKENLLRLSRLILKEVTKNN